MSIDEEVQREIDHHVKNDDAKHAVINRMLEEHEAMFEKHSTRMNGIDKQLGSKISWPWFIATMISIAGLQITMFMYLIDQIRDINSELQETNVGLSTLNGKLAPFDFVEQK